MKKFISIVLPILLTTVVVYLPIFIKPEILLERGNDLTEFFWPIIYFIKNQILTNHELPLWNNQILGGTPLLPDPQSQLFYLPNVIFLFLPIDQGFIISMFLHTFFSGIGTYLCARKGFKFSKYAALFSAILFITTPKLAGYLEAGHYGLVCFMAWIPFLLLSLIKITEEKNIDWSILFAVCLAGCFYTHSLSFVIAVIFSTLVFIYIFLTKKLKIKSIIFFSLGAVLTFGLIAISFLPQLAWQSQTTRYLLLAKPDVYPKWNSILEPFKIILDPWRNINNIDSEKWITFGIIPCMFSLLGFFNIKRKHKYFLLFLLVPILLISLNNASPIYSFLLSQNWYKLLRVSTRLWFIPIVIVTFLSGFSFDKLTKGKAKLGFLTLLAFCGIIESVVLSWTYLNKPINVNLNLAPKEVYEFLSNDKDRFRVFCLNRCLSQKEAAIYNLELLDGYSTLQQNNFYKQSWQFVQSYWDYYSLSFPPMGLYLFEKIKPHAESLSNYNVKYVISPYKINNKKFYFVKKIDNYLIYENLLSKPRAEALIINYSPNYVSVDISKYEKDILTLAEVYSPGWNAYLNGKESVAIQETPSSLRLIKINQDVDFVEFKYEPKSFKTGKLITIATICFLILVPLGKLLDKKIRNKRKFSRGKIRKKIISFSKKKE